MILDKNTKIIRSIGIGLISISSQLAGMDVTVIFKIDNMQNISK
jgi:hypothetical protein